MSQQYKEITPEEANALVEAGADVRYRFDSWDRSGPYCSQSYKSLLERYGNHDSRYSTPSSFWLVYSADQWKNTGTPTFLVEVE